MHFGLDAFANVIHSHFWKAESAAKNCFYFMNQQIEDHNISQRANKYVPVDQKQIRISWRQLMPCFECMFPIHYLVLFDNNEGSNMQIQYDIQIDLPNRKMYLSQV